jgi:hypothetical protein
MQAITRSALLWQMYLLASLALVPSAYAVSAIAYREYSSFHGVQSSCQTLTHPPHHFPHTLHEKGR